MNYSYNGGQYPFPWQNPTPYGYSGAAHQPQHTAPTGPPPGQPPQGPPSAPPGYAVGPPGTQTIVGNTANIPVFSNTPVMYPFPITNPQFQNNNSNQTPPNLNGPFDGNWNFTYGLPRPFPEIQQPIINRGSPVTSQPNSILPNNLVASSNGNSVSEKSGRNSDGVANESSDNLSKSDITEEIALKVSSMLTESNIFKSALSNIQKPKVSDLSTSDVSCLSQNANIDKEKISTAHHSSFDEQNLLNVNEPAAIYPNQKITTVGYVQVYIHKRIVPQSKKNY